MTEPSHLERIAAEAAEAGGDLVEESCIAYEAALRLGGSGWRELYIAHFAASHPAPDPAEPGVLQAGDRVMATGRTGAVHGPATVTSIQERHLAGGRLAHVVEYLLDRPERQADGSERIGGGGSPSGFVHLRDWPVTMIGELPAFDEVREGSLPDGWEPPAWGEATAPAPR